MVAMVMLSAAGVVIAGEMAALDARGGWRVSNSAWISTWLPLPSGALYCVGSCGAWLFEVASCAVDWVDAASALGTLGSDEFWAVTWACSSD